MFPLFFVYFLQTMFYECEYQMTMYKWYTIIVVLDNVYPVHLYFLK